MNWKCAKDTCKSKDANDFLLFVHVVYYKALFDLHNAKISLGLW